MRYPDLIKLRIKGYLRRTPLKHLIRFYNNNLVNLEKALNKIDGEHPRTRIFIAGCSRSGTTLLLSMMKCFDDTHVVFSEHPASYFRKLRNGQRVHVIKRTYRCWKMLHKIPLSVKIIYVVRHPFDVLTSKHPSFDKLFFTEFKTWTDEFHGFEKLSKVRTSQRDLYVVRYEDLVRKPNEIQNQISEIWNLRISAPFAQFHEILKNYKFDEEELQQLNALSGIRPPDLSSVYKWKKNNENHEYLQELITRSKGKILSFLDRFGYERGPFDFWA